MAYQVIITPYKCHEQKRHSRAFKTIDQHPFGTEGPVYYQNFRKKWLMTCCVHSPNLSKTKALPFPYLKKRTKQNKTNPPKIPKPTNSTMRGRKKNNKLNPGLHNPVPPTCISHKLSTSHRNLPTLHITAQCSRQRRLNPWCFRQPFKPPSVYLGSPAL